MLLLLLLLLPLLCVFCDAANVVAAPCIRQLKSAVKSLNYSPEFRGDLWAKSTTMKTSRAHMHAGAGPPPVAIELVKI